MPLSNDRGLVSIHAHHLGKSLLGTVEVGIPIPGNAISVPVFTSKNGSPARTTKRIGYETFPEEHSFTRELVDMRSMGHFFKSSTVSSNGLPSMIINENKKDIGWIRWLLRQRSNYLRQKDKEKYAVIICFIHV
jgi:hypothetical protein